MSPLIIRGKQWEKRVKWAVKLIGQSDPHRDLRKIRVSTLHCGMLVTGESISISITVQFYLKTI